VSTRGFHEEGQKRGRLKALDCPIKVVNIEGRSCLAQVFDKYRLQFYSQETPDIPLTDLTNNGHVFLGDWQ
jgi:hypothetical protein